MNQGNCFHSLYNIFFEAGTAHLSCELAHLLEYDLVIIPANFHVTMDIYDFIQVADDNSTPLQIIKKIMVIIFVIGERDIILDLWS